MSVPGRTQFDPWKVVYELLEKAKEEARLARAGISGPYGWFCRGDESDVDNTLTRLENAIYFYTWGVRAGDYYKVMDGKLQKLAEEARREIEASHREIVKAIVRIVKEGCR